MVIIILHIESRALEIKLQTPLCSKGHQEESEMQVTLVSTRSSIPKWAAVAYTYVTFP